MSFYSGFCQTETSYMGALKLNDSSFISYKLFVKEEGGKISGYSVTDLGGSYETKSNISGSYSKNGELIFKEQGIVYTKSKVTQYDFCFVNFKGKLGKINSKKNINGKFKGLYADGKECISGELTLVNIEKVQKKAISIDKKIQKSKKVSEDKKKQVNVLKSIDTLSMNVMKENQNMSMFTKSKTVKLTIYDSGKEDGDKVAIYVNKKKVLADYIITKISKIIEIQIDSAESTVEIEALNEGEIAPNTANVEITDSENKIQTVTKLKKGKRTRITIINPDIK